MFSVCVDENLWIELHVTYYLNYFDALAIFFFIVIFSLD